MKHICLQYQIARDTSLLFSTESIFSSQMYTVRAHDPLSAVCSMPQNQWLLLASEAFEHEDRGIAIIIVVASPTNLLEASSEIQVHCRHIALSEFQAS